MALELPGNSWRIVKVEVACGGWRNDEMCYITQLEDCFGTPHQFGVGHVRFRKEFPASHYMMMLAVKEVGDRILVEPELDAVLLNTTARQIWINRSQVL